MLFEGNDLITDKKSLADTFNHYFINVVSNLCVNMHDDNSSKGYDSNYDIHRNITGKNKVFSFRNVTKEESSGVIKTLNCTKTTLSNDIPTRIIQQFSNIFTDFLPNNFNSFLENGMFRDELKFAEVVPVFKKNDKKDKSNDRPINILFHISKIYKRCIQTQPKKIFY